MTAIRVARTVEELKALRPILDRVEWGRFEADPEYVMSMIAARDGNPQPFVVVAESGGIPLATFVAIIENIRLSSSFGYRALANPHLRALVGAHGGTLAWDDEAARSVLRTIREALVDGEAEALWCPSLPLDSYPYRLAPLLGSTLFRPGFAKIWTHRRLDLPATFEEFLGNLRKATRADIRRDGRRLEAAFRDRLGVVRLHETGGDVESIATALEHVAAKTYQRGLGAGFIDSPEQRSLIELGLEREAFRAWILEIDGAPVAYWQGSVYGRSYISSATGYDHSFAKHRVGVCLLAHVIGDLCADLGVDCIDWGFGDAEYKRLFSTESFDERDLVVLAPTLKGARVSVTRAAVLGSSAAARKAADTFGVTNRVKKKWRQRRRPDRAQA
jgi:hypothetical protein